MKSAKSFSIFPNDEAACHQCNCRFKTIISGKFNDFEINHPLFWEIIPNPIEQSYLDWLIINPTGIHIVYWPWKEVKFTPIMLSEFIQNSLLNRPIIVYSPNIQILKSNNKFHGVPPYSPYPNILWRWLIKIDYENYEIPVWRKPLNKVLNKVTIPHKEWQVTYKMRHATFTETSINNDFDLPPDSIKLNEKQLMLRCKQHYTKRWYEEVLHAEMNKKAIQPSKLDFHSSSILNSTHLHDAEEIKKHIWFIRSSRRSRGEIQPNKTILDENIQNPQLVIIEDLECFLHTFRRRGFIEFLNSLPKDCLTLMFSTNKRMRYLHKIIDDNFTNIHKHCWDTEARRNWLASHWAFETKFPSPGSSKLVEMS